MRILPNDLREHSRDQGYESSNITSNFIVARIDERIRRKAEDKETKNLNAVGQKEPSPKVTFGPAALAVKFRKMLKTADHDA